MRELELFRRTVRREVRRAVAHHPLSPSHTRGHVAQHGAEQQHYILPVNIDNLSDFQANGTTTFMVGLSAVGGSDPVSS
jgi:hypothetical protein